MTTTTPMTRRIISDEGSLRVGALDRLIVAATQSGSRAGDNRRPGMIARPPISAGLTTSAVLAEDVHGSQVEMPFRTDRERLDNAQSARV